MGLEGPPKPKIETKPAKPPEQPKAEKPKQEDKVEKPAEQKPENAIKQVKEKTDKDQYSKKYLKQAMAEIEKSRTISDAELLKAGAEYEIDEKENKELIPTPKQIEDIRKENAEFYKMKEEKEKEYEGMTEEQRVRHFWETRLKNEIRIEMSQNPNCEFAIVVPVYNEKPERLLGQIESLKKQRGVTPDQFEIIYTVNNDLPSENSKSKEVIAANKKVIEELKKVTGLNVFVIDKSTPGNEIRDCNVGRARNRGLAEASLRFYENSKNGILIQTDADTTFEDPDYLTKLKTIMKENPDVIGVAGGLDWVFKPDVTSEEEKTLLLKKVDRLHLKKKWDALMTFLRKGEINATARKEGFSGAHMISRSYESAVVGGVVEATSGEDPQFGKDLEKLAEIRGQRVIGAKEDLRLTTSARASDRTEASLGPEFNQIDLEKPDMSPDPFVETLPEFRTKIVSILEKAAKDSTELRNLLIDEHGSLMVSDGAFAELVNHIKQNGFVESDQFYEQWRDENLGKGYDLVKKLYEAKYPKIPITEENYERLADKVAKAGGSELVEYQRTLRKIVESFKEVDKKS